MTNTARDAPALLDPEPQPQGGNDTGRHRRSQVALDDLRSYHRVGRMLLDAAVRTGRKQAAAAAVEVFRSALDCCPHDASFRDGASLHNGLGAALLERARLESGIEAVTTLQEAMQAVQAALAEAARQAAPRIVRLRYEINVATVAWMLGERMQGTECLNQAVHILRSASTELSESSPHWSHMQDNLGNALMALGCTEDAIGAYQAALGGRQVDTERGRSLNNLGTAYAEQGRYDDACRAYRDALLLQPRDQVPMAWARTQHNFGSALLQQALASDRSPLVGKQLGQAIEAFEAARDLRRRATAPLDWGVTTANLAGAYLGLGVHFCAREPRPDRRTGLSHIRHAIELYEESLPELPPADVAGTIRNIAIAVQVLGKAPDSERGGADIHHYQAVLSSLAAQYGLTELVGSIGQNAPERPAAGRSRRARTAMAPAPPADLQWPTESYAQAHKARGENIVGFLSRVWLKLIRAGVVDLRTLRAKDPSAAKAIDNFTRKTDPVTGMRRRLPPQLHIPTKKELNDKLAASVHDPGDRPARLDWALRSRARRAGSRK
jgi:tetratricopeptide (TPR) repeat protein